MAFQKTIVKTDKLPAGVGTYSQGVVHNGTYYFSGQIGFDAASGTLAETFDAQLANILKNIDTLLESQGLTRDNIIKTTVFLTDLKEFSKVNDAYVQYFQAPYPARSCVQVSALPRGASVEIEVIAAK